MIELYILKIKENKLTIEDVPIYWREKVKVKLENKE